MDLTRLGMEHAERAAAPLLPLVGLCHTLVWADSLGRLDIPKCVSAKTACIFSRTLTLAVSGSALPPPAPLWSTGSCPLGFCNRSNLAQIGPMRGRAADGIERVAADEQVEIGAFLA